MSGANPVGLNTAGPTPSRRVRIEREAADEVVGAITGELETIALQQLDRIAIVVEHEITVDVRPEDGVAIVVEDRREVVVVIVVVNLAEPELIDSGQTRSRSCRAG